MSKTSSSIYTMILDPELIGLCNDMCHKWVLFSTYNALQGFSGADEFLSDSFVDGMCFLSIGILLYWLVVRQIVTFVPKRKD